MFQTNTETSKRTFVFCWRPCSVRSLTLGCLWEQGGTQHPSQKPSVCGCKELHISVRVCVCVRECLCTCVLYVVCPFNYTIYHAVWITSGFKLKITKPQCDRKAVQKATAHKESGIHTHTHTHRHTHTHTDTHTHTQSGTGQFVFSTNNSYFKVAFFNRDRAYISLLLSSNF